MRRSQAPVSERKELSGVRGWFNSGSSLQPPNGHVVRQAASRSIGHSRARKATVLTDSTQTESAIDLRVGCGTRGLSRLNGSDREAIHYI